MRQRQERPKRKPGNKNPTQTKRRLEAQLEVIQSKLARLNGRSTRQQEPEDEPVARDDYMNRMVVKFYWLQLVFCPGTARVCSSDHLMCVY